MTAYVLLTINIFINKILCYVLLLTCHIICRTTISQFLERFQTLPKHFFPLIEHSPDLTEQNIHSETNGVILHYGKQHKQDVYSFSASF